MKYIRFSAAFLAAAIVSACSGGASDLIPTAPTATSAASTSGTGPTAEPPAANPPSGPGAGSGGAACDKAGVKVAWNGASQATVTNTTASCNLEGVFALFKMADPLPRFETQELFHYKGYRLAPGASVTLTLDEPPCGEYQGDVLHGISEAEVRANPDRIRPPHADPMLVSYRFGDTGRACGPQACTTPLRLSASYDEASDTATVVGNTTPAAGGNMSLEWRLNGGPISTVNAALGQPLSRTFPQAGDRQVIEMRGTYVGTNGAACLNVAVLDIPALPPPTCQGATLGLAFASGPTAGPASVTGSVAVSMAGEAVTGTLSVPGQPDQAVTNGQAVQFTFSRPAYGQPAVTHTITLTTRVNGVPCGTRTVTVTVQPQDPPPPTCEGTVTNLVFASGPTVGELAVAGSVRATLTGTGITGTLDIQGQASQPVTDGQAVGFTFPRQEATYLRTITVRSAVNGVACGTKTLEVEVPKLPPPPCEAANPTRVRLDGAYVNEKALDKGQAQVHVWVQAWVRTYEGKVGLRWRNGQSWRIKEFREVVDKCDDQETKVRFEWDSTSPDHYPSRGAVYDLVTYEGTETNPQNLRSWGTIPVQ